MKFSTQIRRLFSEKSKHFELESKWQKIWREQKKIHSDKEKLYCLSMFPYPSGSLHLGHLRVYTIADLLSRFYKLNGKEVINPIGWDSFGLPAENAANKRGLLPDKWTNENIKEMKDQLIRLGIEFDWEYELSTCEPDYYKATQQLFLSLYKKGLAYKAETFVNWDPIDKTVLANEQVDKEGKSWRSGALVERKKLSQWFIKITDYARTLESDLEKLNKWPLELRDLQKNWIGSSKGAKITFGLYHYSGIDKPNKKDSMTFIKDFEIFSTCAETLFGVTYIAVSPLHPLIQSLSSLYSDKQRENIHNFIQKVNLNYNIEDFRSTIEGFELKNFYAVNPISNDIVPVYLSNYVNVDYGTGII